MKSPFAFLTLCRGRRGRRIRVPPGARPSRAALCRKDLPRGWRGFPSGGSFRRAFPTGPGSRPFRGGVLPRAPPGTSPGRPGPRLLSGSPAGEERALVALGNRRRAPRAPRPHPAPRVSEPGRRSGAAVEREGRRRGRGGREGPDAAPVSGPPPFPRAGATAGACARPRLPLRAARCVRVLPSPALRPSR